MDRYAQDETGQWWCTSYPRGNRTRVSPRVCGQCGKDFINRHPQQFCSRDCRVESTRGIPRIERPDLVCPECGTTFAQSPSRTPRYGARYCSRECGYKAGNKTRGRAGPLSSKWKGGVKPHALGYVREYVPERRRANGDGYVLQHRLVMERILGRPLLKGEEVHHKNAIRHDNRPENLELWLKRQPGGARVTDLLEYARWIIETYGELEKQGKLL